MKERKQAFFTGLVMFVSLSLVVGLGFLIYRWSEFMGVYRRILGILMPLVYGFVITYLLSPVVDILEDRLLFPLFLKFQKPSGKRETDSRDTDEELSEKSEQSSRDSKKADTNPRERLKKPVRTVSVLLTITIAGVLMGLLFALVIPYLVDSITNITKQVPVFFEKLNNSYESLINDNPEIYSQLELVYEEYKIEEFVTTKLIPMGTEFLNSLSAGLINSISSIFKTLGQAVLGLIIAIYLLSGKEKYMAQFRKAVFAFLPRKKANLFIANLYFIHRTFIGFIGGKIVDSVIIGIICYVLMLVLRLPYSVLISIIVGVTNVIPYFGPFIGAIPSALMIVMVNPVQTIYFVIMIVVLQQFDGNVLGPKILGDSTGLSGFWVLFSITLFGGAFGIVGTFIGVPVFAVIYAICHTIINYRLDEKRFPTDTAAYENITHIDYDGVTDRVSHRGKKHGWLLKLGESMGSETAKEESDTPLE